MIEISSTQQKNIIAGWKSDPLLMLFGQKMKSQQEIIFKCSSFQEPNAEEIDIFLQILRKDRDIHAL